MKYSKEFKEEALKLSDEIGLKKAAQQLGIEVLKYDDFKSHIIIKYGKMWKNPDESEYTDEDLLYDK